MNSHISNIACMVTLPEILLNQSAGYVQFQRTSFEDCKGIPCEQTSHYHEECSFNSSLLEDLIKEDNTAMTSPINGSVGLTKLDIAV